MTTISQKSFNCKNEELPVICKFALYGLRRDIADFTAYSPRFNEEYTSAFEAKINEVSELVNPQTETAQQKAITEKLYGTLDGLINPLNRLAGYITMAKASLPISAADFGVNALRKGINAKDAENVINNLRLVANNIERYKTTLTPLGLTDELANRFSDATVSVAADKQRQYEIASNRKNLVQNNMALLNALFEQLSEILAVGKILFKGADPVKLREYTFNELKKQVRRSPGNNTPTDTPPAPETPEA